MKSPRLVLTVLLSLIIGVALQATIGAALQMQLGNPTSATADTSNHAHYLIQRDQYAMDFNDTTHEPNWVSWDLTVDDSGGAGRSPVFFQDTTLPAGFYQVLITDYSGSGYDRGHMCPSADRTATRADNDVTFYMSNMVPQAPDNNQGVWANFETYCRGLAQAGNEVLITSGPSGFAGSTVASGVAIPGYTWKIAVVVPLGPGSAIDRIITAGAANIRVITIRIPNIAGVRSTPWETFVTSVNQIQADTGYTFFTNLPGAIASALRAVVDGQSPVGSPTITGQPNPQTTVVGGSASFTVTATGDGPLTYQWFHDDDEIAGATDATLAIPSVQGVDAGSYYVVVTNNVGSTTSNEASLVVTGLPPFITAPPASQTVNAGTSVTFAVTVTGSPTLTYQWRKDGSPIGGATTSTLTLANVQAADTANYDVVVTNPTAVVTSAPASLIVNPSLPVITGQPAPRTAVTAENASFTVTATGTAPLTYQWFKDDVLLTDGGSISGATTATLLISGVTAVNGGSYDVLVTNALGSVLSAAATLTVNPPPPSTVFWDFTTANPTSGLTAEITGGTVTQGNNNGTTTMLTSVSVSPASLTGGNNAGAAARIGPLVKVGTPTTGSAYFEFTLSPSSGKRLLATGLTFGARSTGTGPQFYSVFTSLDGFASTVATGTLLADSNWHLITTSLSTLTGGTGAPITFRIYGSNGVGSAGANTANWRIDALSLTLSAIFPPPVAPVVTATSPVDGALNMPVTAPITITFNEAVTFTGSWFSINSALNGPLAASVSGGPTSFTLATPSTLPNNDTITVTVFGAQVADLASGTIHGTGNTTFSFTTESYVPPTPPSVTGQPSAQTVFAGSPATFTVAATGTAPLTYQWRKNGSPIFGNATATTASLTLAATTTADAGGYSCVVSNVAGSDLSDSAALIVNLVPPAITTSPVGQIAPVGGSATFTVAASGTGPLGYSWRFNGAPLANSGIVAGAGTPTLTLTGVTNAQSGSYDVVVTNPAGTATSNPAVLAVSSAAPAVIYWDFVTATPTSGIPAGVTGGAVTQGNNNGTTPLLTTTSASSGYTGVSGTFNAGAAARIGALVKVGTPTTGSAYFEFTFTPGAGQQFAATALTFGARSTGTGPQAYAIFSSVDGYTNPVASGAFANDSTWRLITPAFAGVVGSAGAPVTFRIYGYNGAGSPATGTANWRIDDLKLTAGLLATPPVIVTSPASQTVTVGTSVTFNVVATGNPAPTYQWRKDGNPIGGATSDSYTIASPVVADAGNYDVVATNSVGTATSDPATLVVNQGAASVSLGDLAQVYDGSPRAVSVSTTPGGLAVVVTYDGGPVIPTNAGSYAVVAAVNDVNYVGTANGTLVISPAPATVSLSDLSQIYNGSGKAAIVTTNPTGIATTVTYNGSGAPPVNAGSYAVVAAIANPNYAGAPASDTLVVAKAAATVSLGNLSQVFNNSPKPVTVSTTPSGLLVDVTYNGSAAAPTNVGSYAVVATVNETNYTGTATGTLAITAASATVELDNLVQSYDGTPKSVTVTTTPADLAVTVTYDGSATPPTYPGAYAVVATVSDANYTGTASDTLYITTTALVRHGPQINGIVDGSVQVLLPENATLNSSAQITGDLLVPGTPTIKLNGSPVYAGTIDSTGITTPTNYNVTLNSGSHLRHVVRRVNALTMPTVSAPPAPAGTRNVTLNSAGQSPGDFATLRNLTLNSNVGAVTIPAGTYGAFAANGSSSFVLGVAGATVPSVYNLQSLALNGTSRVTIVGPVIINLANGQTLNGSIGAPGMPDWLELNIASGGLALNGTCTVDGFVLAPNGTVTINSGTVVNGGVTCDRLTINSGGLLNEP